MNNEQRLLDSVIQESEEARGDDDAVLLGAGVRNHREPSKMLSVRVPVDTFDDLERVAGKMNVPTSTLVRGYILHGLAKESESVSQTVARVAIEVEKLQRIIGR